MILFQKSSPVGWRPYLGTGLAPGGSASVCLP